MHLEFEGAERGASPPLNSAGRIQSHGGENHSGNGGELFDSSIPIQLDRGHQVFVVRWPTDEELLAHRRQTELHWKNGVIVTRGNARADRELVAQICAYPHINGEDARVIAVMMLASTIEASRNGGHVVAELKFLNDKFQGRHVLRPPSSDQRREWNTYFRNSGARLLVDWLRVVAFYDCLLVEANGYRVSVPVIHKIDTAVKVMNFLATEN